MLKPYVQSVEVRWDRGYLAEGLDAQALWANEGQKKRPLHRNGLFLI
jgi:hypothetical protein